MIGYAEILSKLGKERVRKELLREKNSKQVAESINEVQSKPPTPPADIFGESMDEDIPKGGRGRPRKIMSPNEIPRESKKSTQKRERLEESGSSMIAVESAETPEDTPSPVQPSSKPSRKTPMLKKAIQEGRNLGVNTRDILRPVKQLNTDSCVFPILNMRSNPILMMSLCGKCLENSNSKNRFNAISGTQSINISMCNMCVIKNKAMMELFRK